MHDGPGLRTVVFLAGCPLRCSWCHNPEGQSFRTELLFEAKKCINCGACAAVCPTGAHSFTEGVHAFDRDKCTSCMKCTEVCCTKAPEPSAVDMTADEVLAFVEKDRAFYGENGGVTLSGGEPLAQAREAIELLTECRKRNIGTAVETSGYFDASLLSELVPLVDIFLWDFKDSNDKRHKEYTGVSNERIKNNLLLADSMGAVSILRCITVKGVNAEKEHWGEIAKLWKSLSHSLYAELIPYHAMGGSKMLLLGKPDNGRADWIPTREMMHEAKEYLTALGVKVK